MRTALVIGTGLIGTSIALTLAERGVAVYLADADPGQARTAAGLGAGSAEEPPGQVDLAVVAVPPAHVAATLADAMRNGRARACLDVASVKGGPRRELAALGLDLSGYLGSHPMSGREQSGPLAATADLFEGRPWVLTPTPETDTEVLNLALELVSLCRGVPVVMDADAHDRAVALVSHMPHLVSGLVAARLEHAEDSAVRLCGQGIRDVTRIAASDPRMWIDILSANPGPVADLLGALAEDLEATVAALRALESGDSEKRRAGAQGVERILRRGNAGQIRVPGKHGTAPAPTRPSPSSSPTSRASWRGSSPTPGGSASTSRTSASSTPPGSRPDWSSSWWSPPPSARCGSASPNAAGPCAPDRVRRCATRPSG